MSDVNNVSAQRRNFKRGPLVSPVYTILLGMTLIVGSASVIARHAAEFSVENRAARGEPEAQYRVAKRCFDNARSPHDYVGAASLIRKAAGQGYAKAQAGLGLMYENGLGVPKNYDEALKWLRLAADQGCSVAQNELGVMYAKGRGVQQNLDVASKWCRLAAAQGSEIARKNSELAEFGNARVLPEISRPGKLSYRQVSLLRVEADGVTVSFLPVKGGLGVAKLKPEDLPAELQELCRNAATEGTTSNSAYTQIGSLSTSL